VIFFKKILCLFSFVIYGSMIFSAFDGVERAAHGDDGASRCSSVVDAARGCVSVMQDASPKTKAVVAGAGCCLIPIITLAVIYGHVERTHVLNCGNRYVDIHFRPGCSERYTDRDGNSHTRTVDCIRTLYPGDRTTILSGNLEKLTAENAYHFYSERPTKKGLDRERDWTVNSRLAFTRGSSCDGSGTSDFVGVAGNETTVEMMLFDYNEVNTTKVGNLRGSYLTKNQMKRFNKISDKRNKGR